MRKTIDINKALAQLKKLYSDAGLGPIDFVYRNHSSWITLKSRPNSFIDNKNIPAIDYASKTMKAFEDSVEKNKELLEKLKDEPETTT